MEQPIQYNRPIDKYVPFEQTKELNSIHCSFCQSQTIFYKDSDPFFCSSCGNRFYYGDETKDGRAVINWSKEQQ
jgi:hypothetical protein